MGSAMCLTFGVPLSISSGCNEMSQPLFPHLRSGPPLSKPLFLLKHSPLCLLWAILTGLLTPNPRLPPEVFSDLQTSSTRSFLNRFPHDSCHHHLVNKIKPLACDRGSCRIPLGGTWGSNLTRGGENLSCILQISKNSKIF